MKERFIETNGIRLHVVDHGGDGLPTLLLPGLNANAVFFQGLVRAGLSALRVVAVDLRGRGLSDAPESGYTMEDHAADVLGLMDELGFDRIALVGHSYGGLLSYHLAANHGDRVRRIVAIDSPAEVSPTVVEQVGPALERLRLVSPSWYDYLAAVKAMPYYVDWWDPDLEDYYRADVIEGPDGSIRSRLDPDKIQQALVGTTTIDWVQVANHIGQPVLLMRATEPFGPPGCPPILPADQARRTLKALADARMVELAGNHITALFGESAAGVAEEIVRFVAGDG